MKFKTLKTSVTGKKIKGFEAKMDLCEESAIKIAKEIGFEEWRQDRWAAYGGVEFVYFKDNKNPDPKLWKNTEGGLQPKLNSKRGKEIQARLNSAEKLSHEDLNECVGFEGGFMQMISVSFNQPEYYLFAIKENWEYTPPEDCVEITVTEYKKLENAN